MNQQLAKQTAISALHSGRDRAGRPSVLLCVVPVEVVRDGWVVGAVVSAVDDSTFAEYSLKLSEVAAALYFTGSVPDSVCSWNTDLTPFPSTVKSEVVSLTTVESDDFV